MKKENSYLIPIIYVIMTYMIYAEIFISGMFENGTFSIILIIIGCIIRFVLWVLSLVKASNMRDNKGYLEKMLAIYKYSLIPFYLFNFLLNFLISFIIAVATRGIGVVTLLPFFLPFVIIFTWLATIPGAVCGIYLNRLLSKENKISVGQEIILDIMQIIFFLDVFSTAVTLNKCKKYKVLNYTVIVVYLAAIIGIVIFAMQVA